MVSAAAAVVVCAALGLWTPVRAQDSTPPDTVRVVEVIGTRTVDPSVVRNAFGIRPGTALAAEEIRDGMRRLWNSGLYDDVELHATKAGTNVTLYITVAERRRVTGLAFSGNKKFDEKNLTEKSGLKVGTLLSPEAVTSAVDSIRFAYRKDGYPVVRVRPTVLEDGPGGSRVVFDITEGAKVKVTDVRFEGNAAIPSPALLKVMKMKKGAFKEDVLRDDLERIRGYYKDNGYRDADVDTFRVVYAPDSVSVTITIRVTEGRKYTMSDVQVTGATVIPADRIRSSLRISAGDPYNEGLLRKSVEDIYTAYQESGYLFASVDPQLTPVDSSRLALVIAIQENKPSSVKHVAVTGNKRTKDKVIRRELTVRPGDTFRRSVVARSQRDVYALGFFEDVLIDYKVIPNSSDIDLEFKVKEKSTGSASAGAGYSNDIGLTGFVQLGVPNFMGNGQNVSLHLERGGTDGKQQNYSLSFTEPWLFDSPTVFGVDASYSTTKPLGFPYLETVRGGGVRLGRPLGWIDYTRAFFSLRSEQLTRSDFDTSAVNADTTGYLVSLRDSLHYPLTVSSASVSLVRNSTDSPFYPKSGSRITLAEELAGGPLGGYYKFHKTTFDARKYFRLPLRPALMLRSRAGYVQGGTERSPGDRIPDYERFRLGGTTTNALRGYRDNSIVPAGNSAYKGGRFMTVWTAEIQFLVTNPVHAVLFMDAGNTWNSITESQPLKLKVGFGPGIRMEIPGLGPIGFDYAYGVESKKWESHFVLGAAF